MKVPFVIRSYIVWLAAVIGSIWISSKTVWWMVFPLFGLIVFVTLYERCNSCGHHVAADKNGNGRFVQSTCAKCGASLEDVYPFSYLKRR